MTKRSRAEIIRLLHRLNSDLDARLVPQGGNYIFAGSPAKRSIPARLIRLLVASGLLHEAERGRLAASPIAGAWLKRQSESDQPFRRQHDVFETRQLAGEDGASVLVNLQESPVAALARRSTPNGDAYLSTHAVTAAERLRRDFEIGQPQPRVTANWSASVNTGRRAGDGSGLTDLTDMALAARLRFDRAMNAVGPDLCGLLVDVCCFLKGLETVERERQWPARSAKLVLRLALDALARHYGLKPVATGHARGRLQHWGVDGYRPEIT